MIFVRDAHYRYKYIRTEFGRGFNFYFEEDDTDFYVELWQNFNETGTEIKISNCGRSRGSFWNEYASGYSGRGFYLVIMEYIARAGGWDCISMNRIGEVESW